MMHLKIFLLLACLGLFSCESKKLVISKSSKSDESYDLKAYLAKDKKLAIPAIQWAIEQKEVDLIKKVWFEGENSEARSMAIFYLLHWVNSNQSDYHKELLERSFDEKQLDARLFELYMAYEKLQNNYSEDSIFYADFLKNVFGGEANKKHIVTADKVLVSRLRLLANGQWHAFENYEEYSTKEINEKIKTQLLSLIFDAGNDDPTTRKGCKPNFGVRFSFIKGKKKLDINLCFKCSSLYLSIENKKIRGGDFDKNHKRLLQLVKEIFSDDKAIQYLE